MLKQAGFTLIELMVVIAIIGLLSAIAFPSFQTYQQRVKRNDECKTPLLEIAVLMEEFRAVNNTYPAVGDVSDTTIPYTDDPDDNYTYEITASTASTYTLQCTALNGFDSDCGDLTYDNYGRRDAPSATNGRTAESCWR